MKEFLEKIKNFLKGKKHLDNYQDELNMIFNELETIDREVTKIYKEVMSEEIVSDVKAVEFTNKAEVLLASGIDLPERINNFYQKENKKLVLIATIITSLAVLSSLLIIISPTLAIFPWLLEVCLFLKFEQIRKQSEDKTIRTRFKKKYNDIGIMAQNILTFTEAKNNKFHDSLDRDEQADILANDMEKYYSEEDYLKFLEINIHEVNELLIDGIPFEVIKETDNVMKLARVNPSAKNEGKQK